MCVDLVFSSWAEAVRWSETVIGSGKVGSRMGGKGRKRCRSNHDNHDNRSTSCMPHLVPGTLETATGTSAYEAGIVSVSALPMRKPGEEKWMNSLSHR